MSRPRSLTRAGVAWLHAHRNQMSGRELARHLGVSRTTIYRRLREPYHRPWIEVMRTDADRIRWHRAVEAES